MDGSIYKIRELMPDDAESVIEYSKKVGGETDFLSFGSDGFPTTVDDERAFLAKLQEDPGSVMLGVFKEDELVADGSINALKGRMSHRAGLGIAVVKEYWNKGIGSALMAALIDHAKNAGIEIIDLEVRCDNIRAIRLYEKFGFKRLCTYPSFFRIGNEYYDFELMCLDLRK